MKSRKATETRSTKQKDANVFQEENKNSKSQNKMYPSLQNIDIGEPPEKEFASIKKPNNACNDTMANKEGNIEIEDNWNCKMCTIRNDYTLERCEACENEGPHFDKWRCEMCTFINEKHCPQCKACGRQNKRVMVCPGCGIAYINQLFEKACKMCRDKMCRDCERLHRDTCRNCLNLKSKCYNERCNFVNSSDNEYCERCYASGNDIPSLKDKMVEVEMWQCTYRFCHYFNELTNANCVKCFNGRYPSHFGICCACGWNHVFRTKKCPKCFSEFAYY